MKSAITFVNNQQVSITTTREEIIKEINHYRAFWLSNVGAIYHNAKGDVRIVIDGMTADDRHWLSARMR